MSAGEIHVGDIGTVFQVTVKDGTTVVDVSSATTLQLIFTKPSGSITVTASLVNTGTDGLIKYAFVSGDLNIAGRWRYQVRVVISSSEWKSDIGSFTVHKNL